MPQKFWALRPRIYLKGDNSVTFSVFMEREGLARGEAVQEVLPLSSGQRHERDVTGQNSSPLKK